MVQVIVSHYLKRLLTTIKNAISFRLMVALFSVISFGTFAQAAVDITTELAQIDAATPENEQKLREMLKFVDGDDAVLVKLRLARSYRKSSQADKAKLIVDELLVNIDDLPIELQIKVHVSNAQYFRATNQYAKAVEVMEKYALPLAEPDSPQLGILYQHTGVFYRLQMKLLDAKEYYFKALDKYQISQDEEGEAEIYGNLGVLYASEGDLVLAAEYQIRSMRYFEERNDVGALAGNYFSLAELYYKSQQYDESLAYYFKALEFDLKLNSMQDVGYDYHRIGSIYLKQGLLDEATRYTEKAANIFVKHSAPQVLARAYLQLAKIATQQELNTERLLYIDLAEQAALESGAEHQLGLVWRAYGQYFFDTEQNVEAKDYFERALAITQKKGLLEGQLREHELLSQVYNKLDEPNEAFEHLSAAYDLKQQLDSEQRINELERHKRDINLLQEQVKVAKLEEQRHKAEQQIVEQRSTMIVIVFIAALILVFLVLAIYLLGQRRKIALLRAKLYEDALSQKNQLLADVSHELRTPLTALKLQVDSLRYHLVDDVDLSYQKLSTKITDLNHLISDIYELALSDVEGFSFNKHPVDVIPLLSAWSSEFAGEVKAQNLTWTSQFTVEHAVVNIDIDRIKQVFANVVSNSIKYTDKPGMVDLNVAIKGKEIVCVVQDTAPSVDEDELDKIFERLYRVEKSRNRKTGGSGLGLAICRNIINAHQGNISAKKGRLGGIAIVIKLPIYDGK
ncbi:hypothetical protein tloyanaT_22450 [Thalassotalea loyana]|uniref:histidine kinase n=1 Tax=Thalassotalea loyana TaxID=280483 RepID=A0ABQ6HD28_9GAMM|nr:ATP-binding protein [Thalassotalea loyana]GLX85993.1 hypothetical protein tloyanaT_22450 [Thalassotalea loyana]